MIREIGEEPFSAVARAAERLSHGVARRLARVDAWRRGGRERSAPRPRLVGGEGDIVPA